MNKNENSDGAGKRFQDQAQEGQTGFWREFFIFLLYNKKWWLTPILIVLALVGLLVIAGGTALAPFIYPFF